jgi:hypothetical protein
VWAPHRSGDRAARLAAFRDPDVRRRLVEAAGEPGHRFAGYERFYHAR